MGSIKQLNITLPAEMARRLSETVAAGEYATESEAIQDGLRIILGHDPDFERWLREEAGPAYDAVKADPGRALTVDQVRLALSALHKETIAGA